MFSNLYDVYNNPLLTGAMKSFNFFKSNCAESTDLFPYEYTFFFAFAWVLLNFCWHSHRFIRNNTHSAKIFRQYCRNILWKYWKNAKIFQNLSLILLKYFNNVAMSAQNMTYAIFSKYRQTNKCLNHPHSIEYCKNMSEIFPIFYCNCNIAAIFLSIIPQYFIAKL